MKQFAILRFSKLKSLQNVAASGQHTWRERDTPNADPQRTPRNKTIGAKGSIQLVEAIKARHAVVSEKISATSVAAIEVLATASPGWWKKSSQQNISYFFERTAEWLNETFGDENVVSMTIHFDETSPHLVAYISPVIEVASTTRRRSIIVGTNPDGTKRRETKEFQTASGYRLSAAHWLDGRKKLSRLQTDFAKVMEPIGLSRGVENSRAKHQSIKIYYARVAAPLPILPNLRTPKPLPMPPKPQPPGFLASKVLRAAYESWHREAARREQQVRAHQAELIKRGMTAVELVEELTPQARERDQAVAAKELLEQHLDRIRERALRAEERASKAEAVASLFTAEEVEFRQRQREAEKTKLREIKLVGPLPRNFVHFFKPRSPNTESPGIGYEKSSLQSTAYLSP
ncbi:MobV family relaxase [Uliginosibacterium paludis]|uniref:MobV family relaxase n=1 Tax=Uliginosibacterium paludis TaxID=1615952 RepID=A0ABV2CM35_9RHOO